MSYKLFLDDIRDISYVYPNYDKDNWIVARTFNSAKTIIQEKFPYFISFDHDLGEDMSGYDFAKYIIEFDFDHDVIDGHFDFSVHSANPVGRENIESLLNRYLKRMFPLLLLPWNLNCLI